MYHHHVNTRILTLLAAGGLFCLLAGSAHAQRSSGRGATGNRATTASTTSGTTGTSTTGSSSSTGKSCPSNSSSSGTGTTSGTTSTGTTVSSAASTQSQSTAISPASIQAVRTSASQLAVQYSGSTAGVQTVYVAVLDANRNVLQQQVITQNPVRASLSLASSARYYGVKVVYANGTSKMLVSAIK